MLTLLSLDIHRCVLPPTLHHAPRPLHVSASALLTRCGSCIPVSTLSFKWVYLVVTYDGAVVRMFVNAELVAQVLGSTSCGSTCTGCTESWMLGN